MPYTRRSNLGRRTNRAISTRNFRTARNRINRQVDLTNAAFRYDSGICYKDLRCVDIGLLSTVCKHCNALKFKTESLGLCCANGKVKLPLLTYPPEPLYSLLYGNTNQSKHFLSNIQKYNRCFQMTSFGADVVDQPGYNPSYKIQGQIHHRVGSLLPPPNDDHKFLQIYFVGDSEIELDHRCAIFIANKREIIGQLQILLHEHNELVRLFKISLDSMHSDDHKIIIRADKRPTGGHARQFNAPTINEVAVVIVGENVESRDIILKRRNDGQLQRLNETHRSYDALQYPLMFCRGEDGYHFNIMMVNPTTGEETNKKVSAMNFYAYRLMIRQGVDNHLMRYRRLFQQYCVDMYVKVETERLNFIRFNQLKLRSEEYIHLRDAIATEGHATNIGCLTILPATYVGSPRHMHEYAQDAMTYVRNYGRPDLFITFTCNPNWTEITNLLFVGQTCSDRHDITARVFKQKVRVLIDYIVKKKIFGALRCWMYSVEWQKRGLPHVHILLWLIDKIEPDKIDLIISAEIPDPGTDPELYSVVINNMIHGPCGIHNPYSVCMENGKCTKRFPRPLVADTISGNDGYPLYRRRSLNDNGRSIVMKVKGLDVVVDNSWIVPYCPLLSKTFSTHCNVEYCNSIKSIKYICKYINKGSDMAMFGIVDPNANDEVMKFQIGRYVSCNEAIWRLFSFPIHERYPTVVHLAVHLENGQRVYFTEENAAQRAERPPTTTLTNFFSICQTDPFARTLLYSEMPRYYTWNINLKKFQRRKQGEAVIGFDGIYSTDALGRIYTVHPRQDECFYLRLLLVNIRGPTSFDYLRTVDGVLCDSFREACQRLNLLENDNHWDSTLADAIVSANSNQIRTLFAIIIATCHPSNPAALWEKYKDEMADDILYRLCTTHSNLDFELIEHARNEALVIIEDMCVLMCGSLLSTLGMPAPNRLIQDAYNREFNRELDYDREELTRIVRSKLPKLNNEQKNVYDKLMKVIDDETGGIYFLDAPGGTGKTFVISLILATIRSRSKIALAVASSGIAATLLEGGRTAHSALKLPLNILTVENPTCSVIKNSATAKLMKDCKIIIWDECTMAHKRSLEAVNRTLKDLRNDSREFGGAMILLAGDFRQTLPVIPKSTAADEYNACLKSSFLWHRVKIMKLTINMRVVLHNTSLTDEFSRQLLALGNGQIPIDNSTGLISLPDNFCSFTSSKEELINKVFPNIAQNYRNFDWISERAILAAKNKDVDILNLIIQSQIEGELYSYKSVDSVTNEDEATDYPSEFLNSLEVPGAPPHNLQLKVGSIIIMLRNLNHPKLCNGTRLSVNKLMNNLIQATIIKGKFKGELVLIPRIPIIPTDLPFQFKRIQFPIRLAFAMTINKSQGQSLEVCGINLEFPCFSHGQLYVACSRVGKPSSLFVYAPEKKTKNIVYQIALN